MSARIHGGHVLCAAGLIAPILTVFAPLALAPLVGVCGAVLLVIAWRESRLRNIITEPVSLFFLALFACAAASILWSANPDLGSHRLIRLAVLFVAGATLIRAAFELSESDRDRVARMLLIGVISALCLLAFERITVGGILGLFVELPKAPHVALLSYNRAATALALMVWPAAITVGRQNRLYFIVLLGFALVLLVSLESGGALAGLLFGIAAYLLARWSLRPAVILVGAVATLYMLAAPYLHNTLLDPGGSMGRAEKLQQEYSLFPRSAYHRLLIWNFTARRIADRPILGWGFQSSRGLPGGMANLDVSEQAMPLHPHNAALQIWLELGIPGVFIVLAWIFWSSRRFLRWPDSRNAAGALAVFATGYPIACVSYSIWQSWWIGTFILAGAFCATVVAPKQAAR